MNLSATSIGNESSEIRADSISHGIVLMLTLTVVQRSMGFVRNVLICRLMDPAELGNWNLAFSFLETVAPFVVLGVPGCFGRYVEYFRKRQQLRGFLKKTTAVTVACTVIGSAIILLNLDAICWLTFGSSDLKPLLVATIVALLFVIAFNFCVVLLTALRQVRNNSYLQFINSLIFTLCSTMLLYATELGTLAVIISYGVACLLTTIVAVFFLKKVLVGLSITEQPLTHKSLWLRVGPFIGWFWLTDFMTNTFSMIDRLMMLHFAGVSELHAKFMIGQYHSSRIIGMLLVAIVGMLSSVLLSYVSHEWESGRKKEAAGRLDFALKLIGISLTAVAILSLIGSPIIFGWALGGKYMEGSQVLPATLAYCIWFSLIFVAANYIWCHEKPILTCLTVGIGLLTNILLNFLWLPKWGLQGAIAATSVSNFLTLVLTCVVCHLLGMRFSPGAKVAMVLPGMICWGILPATAVLIVVLWTGHVHKWLFSEEEADHIKALARRFFPSNS